MHFHQGMQRFATASQFADYVIHAFDQLWREGGRMMSVGLHLRLIGRPGRVAGLERVLRHMRDVAAPGSPAATRSPATGCTASRPRYSATSLSSNTRFCTRRGLAASPASVATNDVLPPSSSAGSTITRTKALPSGCRFVPMTGSSPDSNQA